MLAAYMRLRYPHIVTGSIAASSPFRWITGEEGLHPFFESIKEVCLISQFVLTYFLVGLLQCK